MPPVPQVAQQISQEGDQQQNGPNLPSLHNSFPLHIRNPAFPQQVQPAGWDKKHVVVDPAPVPSPQQENEILQRITALRKEGLWSLKRLPKLHEAPRHKSHHDYLLEEMQWMATDFMQERRWKIITASRLILSVARHHEDMVLHKETWKKREEKQLRAVAAFTAREVEHFWSTIKQVVDLKLQVELEERRKKALHLQNVSRKGKMEALAVLLQELKVRGERVLIWTQMIPMLDILEIFLSLHLLTYVRVGESGAHSWHYLESIKNFNQDKRIFCALLSSHTPSTGVSHVDVNAVVFCGTDLDLQGDMKAGEWCAKIARGRDIHIYRLVSGHSVEERLLKKGIKHLIRELAAQGDNCSTDFLTQVFCSKCGKEDSRKFTEETQSELRNDTDSELYDSRNTMVPSQLEQLASLVDQSARRPSLELASVVDFYTKS